MSKSTNIQNQENSNPEDKNTISDKILVLLSKLDTFWGKLIVVGIIFMAGHQFGQMREELIKIAEINKIDKNYGNDILDQREKYLNEIIELKQINSQLNMENKELKQIRDTASIKYGK